MLFRRAWFPCLPSIFAVLSGQTISFLPPVGSTLSGASRATYNCATCLATADFNGDGSIDIVFSYSEIVPSAGVLLGNGDGTFRPGFTFGTRHSSNAPPIAVGDFNGDGKSDVVFLGDPSSIYLGHGDGTFAGPFQVADCNAGLSWADGTPNYFTVVSIADVDRDGKQDLICGPTVLLSQGDGSFRAGPATLAGDAQLVADFNHDGIPDILLTTESGQFAVVLGRGDGTFAPDLLLSSPLYLPPYNGMAFPLVAQAGDFNGDGKIDLAGTSPDGTGIVVLPGHGDGMFGSPIKTAGVPGAITASADFNRDGKLDLVTGDAVLAGNGDGTFRFPVFVGVATDSCTPNGESGGGLGCRYTHEATVVADLNGDGLPDLVAGYRIYGFQSTINASFSALLNDSPGDGFTATGVSSATGTWPVGPGSLVSAFGVNLASTTETAPSGPLPTTLGGIQVHVRDRSHTGDTLAPLLYVSPTQINYLLTSSDPFAWVGIERVGSPYVAKGMSVPINTLAPGLFAMGAGFAAASAVIVTPQSQTPFAVTSCSALACRAVPIDVSGPPVYLSLYGTGFALASTAGSTCTIARHVLPVTYAGPQTQFPGLDQVNVLLPASLAGTGATSVSCSFVAQNVAPTTTNSVYLTIK